MVKHTTFLLRKIGSIIVLAFMLGMSNAILEETRTLKDTRPRIEYLDLQKEDAEL